MVSVCLVAAPLVARSGVYRSARETVLEARRQGLDWSLYLGVSSRARGERPADDPPWLVEDVFEPNALRGVHALRRSLARQPITASSEILISLNPQADMALATMGKPWVAYLRGQPWPAPGESPSAKRLAWQLIERVALRRAAAIWATTTTLRQSVDPAGRMPIVPAGIKSVPRTWDGRGNRRRVVWAARYERDKNPFLFSGIISELLDTDLQGRMFGSGPLEAELCAAAPDNLAVCGWAPPNELWEDALVYVGTSHREAFGRSAVEAAMAGVPVIVSQDFGAAELLYTDVALRRRFVLDPNDISAWSDAIRSLRNDEGLRVEASNHVFANANKLSIEHSVRVMRAQLAQTFGSHLAGVSNGGKGDDDA